MKTLANLFTEHASEIAVLGGNAFTAAAKTLGWPLKQVDPQGNPQTATSDLQTLVTEGVDGVFSSSWDPSQIEAGLVAAHAKNLPVLNVWGNTPSSPLESGADFASSDVEFGAVSAKWFFAHLPAHAQIALLTSGQLGFGHTRDQVFLKIAAQHPGVKIVANHQTDYTNAVGDTTKAITDILNAYPHLAGIWMDSTAQTDAVATVLKSEAKCGKVLATSFYAPLSTLADMREGCITAVFTAPLQAQSWVAVDQMAARLVSGKPLPAGLPGGYPFDYQSILTVTKANVPTNPNQNIDISYNYEKYFAQKWARLYGSPG